MHSAPLHFPTTMPITAPASRSRNAKRNHAELTHGTDYAKISRLFPEFTGDRFVTEQSDRPPVSRRLRYFCAVVSGVIGLVLGGGIGLVVGNVVLSCIFLPDEGCSVWPAIELFATFGAFLGTAVGFVFPNSIAATFSKKGFPPHPQDASHSTPDASSGITSFIVYVLGLIALAMVLSILMSH